MYHKLLTVLAIILSFLYGFTLPTLTAIVCTIITTVVLCVGGAWLDEVRG